MTQYIFGIRRTLFHILNIVLLKSLVKWNLTLSISLYPQEQEIEKQKLLFNQARLADRGVAEMVLLHISACKGIPSEMVMKTLQLGISILRGGNIEIQRGMLNHLKEKKDVGFFTSIAGLMNSCSVLDLDAFERNTKAEGLGVGADGAAGEKNMHDAEFTCALFRFIQLTCEGHNLGEL